MFRWVRAFCDEANFPLLSTPKSLFTIVSIREQETLPTMKTRFTQIEMIPQRIQPAKWSEMKNMQKIMSNSELEAMPQPSVSQIRAEAMSQSSVSQIRAEAMSQSSVSQKKTVGNVVDRRNLKVNHIFNLVAIWFVFIAKSILYTVITKLNSSARFTTLRNNFVLAAKSERGDVPGWVLVVLMTTGLVTGIWTVAQPRLSSILKNSLDNMNSIR